MEGIIAKEDMKVLILYLSAGTGHLKASHALKEAFFRVLGTDSDVEVADLLEYAPSILQSVYAKGYDYTSRYAPELLDVLYQRFLEPEKENDDTNRKLRLLWDKISTPGFLKRIKNFAPDVIVATHPDPLILLSDLRKRKKIRAKVVGILTDYEVHSGWVHPYIDRYYVATEEMASVLKRLKIPSRKVRATGIPIGLDFANPRTRSEAIISLGLHPQKKTIFVLHGLTGRTKTASVVKELVRIKRPDLQLVVGIGKGEQVKDEVEAILKRSHMPYKLYGFIDDMVNKLAATDLIITKPGGLIVSECLAMHIPLLLINPTPGQEEANAIFLLERGVAMYLRNVTSLAYKLSLMLDDPSHYRRIKDRLFAIGKPNASLEIAMDVVQLVSRRKVQKEV